VFRSLSRWLAVLLGSIVLLGLGLAGLGLFAVGTRHWFPGGAFHVRCGFQNIQGVEVGTRVRIQGIDAGEVVAIQPPGIPGDEVILRLRLNGRLRPLVRSDATVQILSEGLIGGKALEINPGTEAAGPAADEAQLGSRPTTELADVLHEVKTTLQKVRDGEGTLGRELLNTLQQTRATMQSVEKSGEAVRKLPIVRSYSKDAGTYLIRPDCERVRTVFAETDLFEPGRATLTSQGRQRLDDLVPRLKGNLRRDKAGLVVVACANPKTTADRLLARTVTEAQSTAVCTYLRDHHTIQKAGWITWRDVTALGLGTDSFPGESPEEHLPPGRIEILVFVPQK
jgi:phospholipid/cholesterol/gamma-HCH transport system substrate-binding protein